MDRSDRTKLLLRGGETLDFLQGQVTNDVEALAPGSGCYAAILTHKGKLRTDLRILRGEDWVWLDCDPIGGAVLRHTVQTYSLGRDVSLTTDRPSARFSRWWARARMPPSTPRRPRPSTPSWRACTGSMCGRHWAWT